MQVSVETLEGLQRRITVELPAEQVNKVVEDRLRSIARTVRMDGFRPGKVPFNVVRQRYGAQARQEAWGDLIQNSYYSAITQQGLRPAGDPLIDDVKDEDGRFVYSAKIEVVPEVALQELGDASVEKTVAVVTDADVDAMIEKLRDQRSTWSTVERAAADGDQVTVSFVGKIDGEAFEGGSAQNIPVVMGAGAMIDGFEAGILGAKAGDERHISVNFPDDYRVEHLAGKPATFDITVKAVAEKTLPEVNEAFIKAFGVKEGTVEGLRSSVRDNMERELDMRIKQLLKDQAMNALLAEHDFVVPEVMVKAEAERLMQETRQNMQQQTGAKGNFELPLDLFKEQAERRVKLGLLVGEIVKRHQMTVDETKVRSTVEKFASSYDQPQEVIDWYYASPERLDPVRNVVLEEQVVDWIMTQVKVTEKSSSFNELIA